MLDINNHNTSAENTRRLIRRAGLNQKSAAAAVGVGYSTMKKYVSVDGVTPYLVQFALEILADAKQNKSGVTS